jgi:hypothetical protein
MLDLQIQKEILDEINQKSDDKNPVILNLTDPVRKLNFQELCSNKCFLFFENNKSQSLVGIERVRTESVMNSLAKLSHQGHKHRFDIVVKIETSRREQENNESLKKHAQYSEEANRIAKGANTRATCAIAVSVICAVISLPSSTPIFISWLSWILGWIGWL